MAYGWRTTIIELLLIVNIGGIVLAFTLGRILPASAEIAFQFGQGNSRSSQPQIYETGVKCESSVGDCATLLKSTLSYSLYPSFSPDGRQIMLLSNDSNNSQELYLLSVADGSTRQLTSMGGQIASARWRPMPP